MPTDKSVATVSRLVIVFLGVLLIVGAIPVVFGKAHVNSWLIAAIVSVIIGAFLLFTKVQDKAEADTEDEIKR